MSIKWRRYNPRQVWKALKFESSRSVIIVHLHIVVVRICGKLWLLCDTDDVLKLSSTRTLPAFPCCICHGISSWICVVDYYPVSKSGTETILALNSSSESLRPQWWFFTAGIKELGWLWFSSRTALLPLAGIDSHFLVSLERHWNKTWSSSLHVAVQDRCQTVSSSVRWKLVSYGLKCKFWRSSGGLLQML